MENVINVVEEVQVLGESEGEAAGDAAEECESED